MTESEVGDLPHVTYVRSRLENHTIEIEGDFGQKTPVEIVQELTNLLQPRGYAVSMEPGTNVNKWRDFTFALPIAIGFATLFVIMQKLGIVNLVDATQVTYGTAFVIGIVASLSTCMAVVGGLLLSMSATFAREGERFKPQIMFHGGRLVSFFVLGGFIGSLGAAFALNATATFIISLIIGLVMFVLGLNLLDIFPWAKKLQPSMPQFIARRAHNLSKYNHTLTPLLVGIATFFLPCGFTQSMQIYTLTTGNFLQGGLTMLAFALGTLPVLALVSFSSSGLKNYRQKGVFFKSAGLVVIMFAIFNLVNSLAAIGLISPLFNF